MPFINQYKRRRQPWETTTSKLEERERKSKIVGKERLTNVEL